MMWIHLLKFSQKIKILRSTTHTCWSWLEDEREDWYGGWKNRSEDGSVDMAEDEPEDTLVGCDDRVDDRPEVRSEDPSVEWTEERPEERPEERRARPEDRPGDGSLVYWIFQFGLELRISKCTASLCESFWKCIPITLIISLGNLLKMTGPFVRSVSCNKTSQTLVQNYFRTM